MKGHGLRRQAWPGHNHVHVVVGIGHPLQRNSGAPPIHSGPPFLNPTTTVSSSNADVKRQKVIEPKFYKLQFLRSGSAAAVEKVSHQRRVAIIGLEPDVGEEPNERNRAQDEIDGHIRQHLRDQ